MVSARLVDLPDEPEEDDSLPIPDMMFVAGEEPVGVRVLTYQSSSALKRIFNALEAEEIDFIRRSSFGKLLDIADKPVFSGRFARYLLSRQLKTEKKHEAWFRYTGHPIRFSLREFAIVTGLPCGIYPPKSKMKLKKTIYEKPFWPTLFGKVEVVTVSSVIKMLYRKTVKDRTIRIRYACLALLESVLLPTSLNMKIAREHVEAIEDLEEFFSYPWGRVAFELLMGSIKERDEVALSQNTIAVKGFVLALQLVIVEAVPALTEIVQEICSSSESDSDDVDGKGHDIFTKKNTLNPAHGRNVDKRINVRVSCILAEDSSRPIDESCLVWSDEVVDLKVANLVSRINANHQFRNSIFRRGLTHADVERLRESFKASSKSRKSAYGNSQVPNIEPGNLLCLVMEKIKPQLDNINNRIDSACSAVSGIEEKVDVQVKETLQNFKEDMFIRVKEIVTKLCMEKFSAHVRASDIGKANPVEGTIQPPVADAVEVAPAETIGNVLKHLSDYTTPPRSNRMSQDDNLTPKKKPGGGRGFDSGSMEAETCDHSENIANKRRQNAYQLSLEAYKSGGSNLVGEPTFSLGLTQEENNECDNQTFVTERCQQECPIQNNGGDNIEESHCSRRSKRHKTVPSGLFEDYQCGRYIMSRVREAQKYIFALDDLSDTRNKYAKLCLKLRENFTVNVAGMSVSAKQIQQILERPRFVSAQVVDILIRLARRSLSLSLPTEGPQSAAFLDTKFVTAIGLYGSARRDHQFHPSCSQ